MDEFSAEIIDWKETVKTAVSASLLIARSTNDIERTTHGIIKNILINYMLNYIKPDCYDAVLIELGKEAKVGIEKFHKQMNKTLS